MKRNYFERPLQHSRSQHDYGNSGPIEPMYQPVGMFWNTAGVAIGALVIALMFFAWIS